MFNMQAFQSFVSNPGQFFAQQGIPQDIKTPGDAIQYLLNSGKLSQADYNNLQAQARQLQNSPMFKQFFK